ncbi:hypothetical protein OQX63_17240 [Pedobacter sp. PF22-3]|uniref:hypothetical protein n=1 Tax=Pedobacter sp. PF22-3 TaxID=2994467 RepID=UPI0022465F85|nr:hypothetical protein [Pedobacter sp. PF22-3]MCX2495238.1 hypothetical protein [Pedobacter sp. PF22-3]
MNWDDDNLPLVEFITGENSTYFTQKHAFTSVSIMGSTGSGKSSTSFCKYLTSYLKAGYGGILLTTKITDTSDYRAICEEAERGNDVRIISVGGNEKFDFLEYEFGQGDNSEGTTDNIVDLLKTVIEAGQGKDTGSQNDPFWSETMLVMLSNTIDLIRLAYGKLSIQLINDVIQSLPRSKGNEGMPEEKNAFELAYDLVKERIMAKVEHWEQSFEVAELEMLQTLGMYENNLFKAIPEARTFKAIDQFTIITLGNLAEKTRSIVDMKISGFLYRLLREPIYSLFCDGSTLTPDMCADGAIIIIDLPVKKYEKVGRDVQLLFKLIFQRYAEKRDLMINNRPLFIACDEAQSFIIPKDLSFQLTARGGRIACLYSSQSLINFYSFVEGRSPEHIVKAWQANIGCKIWHLNTCQETNEWAANIIGEDYFLEQTYSNTLAENVSQTSGSSYKLRKIVLPSDFSKLKNGSAENDFEVEAYIHIQGKPLFGRDNHFKAVFLQSPLPPKS